MKSRKLYRVFDTTGACSIGDLVAFQYDAKAESARHSKFCLSRVLRAGDKYLHKKSTITFTH